MRASINHRLMRATKTFLRWSSVPRYPRGNTLPTAPAAVNVYTLDTRQAFLTGRSELFGPREGGVKGVFHGGYNVFVVLRCHGIVFSE